MAGLTLDKVEYGRLLAERLPHKVVSDAEYDRLADEVEQITFDADATPELQAYADLAVELLAAYDRRAKIRELSRTRPMFSNCCSRAAGCARPISSRLSAAVPT